MSTSEPHQPLPRWSPSTQALHAGLQTDPVTGAIAPGLTMSVNHRFVPGEAPFSADGVDDLAQLPYLYARWGNPTVRQLELRLAALEGAEDALATATGVAAIAAMFFTGRREKPRPSGRGGRAQARAASHWLGG